MPRKKLAIASIVNGLTHQLTNSVSRTGRVLLPAAHDLGEVDLHHDRVHHEEEADRDRDRDDRRAVRRRASWRSRDAREPGATRPSAIPTAMQRSTHSVSRRSKPCMRRAAAPSSPPAGRARVRPMLVRTRRHRLIGSPSDATPVVPIASSRLCTLRRSSVEHRDSCSRSIRRLQLDEARRKVRRARSPGPRRLRGPRHPNAP